MAEKISDILSRTNIIPKPSFNNDAAERESGGFWIERNIGKFPIYFTGSEKMKKKIETEIDRTGEPFVISKQEYDGGYKTLAVAPNSVYGLIDGDDAKVVNAIFQYLDEEIRPRLGYIPKKFRMQMRDFCRVMFIKIHGGHDYKRIFRSLETVDSFTIKQSNFFNAKGKSIIKTERLHILRLGPTCKEDRKTNRGLRNKEFFVEIELEDWMIKNLEDYYATKIDKEIYFKKLDSQRSRRLFEYLCMCNFQKEVFVKTSTITELLWITDEENFNKKISIIRSIEPIVKAGVLESYEFDWDEIKFIFTKVRPKRIKIINPEEKNRVDSVVLKILEEFGDIKSEKFYRLIAAKIPENIINICLSEVKDLRKQGKLSQTRAYFVDMLDRECKKRGVKVPFRRKSILQPIS